MSKENNKVEAKKIKVTTDLIDEHELINLGVPPEALEKVKLQINSEYKQNLEEFKDSYNRYAQAGRSFTTTRIRRIKKNDLFVVVNMENDTFTVERVQEFDGTNVKSKTFIFPANMIKSIEIRLMPIINLNNKILIHLAIVNIRSGDIANKMRNLSDSVFMQNILKYNQKGLGDKPLLKIIIGAVLGGLVFYIVMLWVFKKIIVQIVGDITNHTPTS